MACSKTPTKDAAVGDVDLVPGLEAGASDGEGGVIARDVDVAEGGDDSGPADAGREDGRMIAFDTGFTGFDAQDTDGGGLPPGYSLDCVRMATEGCWAAFAPCDSSLSARIEYSTWNGQTTCRCVGWPLIFWEAGNGYRQRCDGTYRNHCREQGPLRNACDEGMVCSGALDDPAVGTSSIIRYLCGMGCARTASLDCVERTSAGCCRTSTDTRRVCDDDGALSGTSPCPFPLIGSYACVSLGGSVPDCH